MNELLKRIALAVALALLAEASDYVYGKFATVGVDREFKELAG